MSAPVQENTARTPHPGSSPCPQNETIMRIQSGAQARERPVSAATVSIVSVYECCVRNTPHLLSVRKIQMIEKSEKIVLFIHLKMRFLRMSAHGVCLRIDAIILSHLAKKVNPAVRAVPGSHVQRNR